MNIAFGAIIRRLVRPILLLLAVVAPLEGYLHYRWLRMMRPLTEEYLGALQAPVPGRTRVLITGDSHPHNALPAAALPDSLANVAFGSDGVRDTELKIRALLARGVVPEYLIFEADDHILTVAREAAKNEALIVLGVSVNEYNQVYGRSISHLKHWSLRYLPLTDVRNRNVLFLALSEQFQKRIGTLHNPLVRPADGQTWAGLSAAGRAKIVENRRLSTLGTTYALSPTLVASWTRILQLCRAQGIRVVAVRYPLTPEYLTAAAQHYDMRPMRALLQALPPDTLLDYTRLFTHRPDYFEDADHLSAPGGAAFTTQFLEDLRGVKAALPLRLPTATTAYPGFTPAAVAH